MMVEIVGSNTKPETNPSSSRENSPIEKQGSQDPNLDEPGVQTNTKSLPSAKEEEKPLPL